MNSGECEISRRIIKLKSTVALSDETYFPRCFTKRIFPYCDDNNNMQFRVWRVFKCFLLYCFRNDIFTRIISKYAELCTILKLSNGWNKFKTILYVLIKVFIYFIIIIQKSSIASKYFNNNIVTTYALVSHS